MPAHFKTTCSAIDQLPSNPVDLDGPSLPDTGLSQDLENDTDSVSVPAEQDRQSGEASQQRLTPGTSFTDSGAAKRMKRGI